MFGRRALQLRALQVQAMSPRGRAALQKIEADGERAYIETVASKDAVSAGRFGFRASVESLVYNVRNGFRTLPLDLEL